MIRFLCPGCDRVLKIDPDHAGQVGLCPTCKTRFEIPREEPADNSPDEQPQAAAAPSPAGATAAEADPDREPAPRPRVVARPADEGRPHKPRRDDDDDDDEPATRNGPPRFGRGRKRSGWLARQDLFLIILLATVVVAFGLVGVSLVTGFLVPVAAAFALAIVMYLGGYFWFLGTLFWESVGAGLACLGSWVGSIVIQALFAVLGVPFLGLIGPLMWLCVHIHCLGLYFNAVKRPFFLWLAGLCILLGTVVLVVILESLNIVPGELGNHLPWKDQSGREEPPSNGAPDPSRPPEVDPAVAKADKTLYLSELTPFDVQHVAVGIGVGYVSGDRGTRIRVGGQESPHGIGMHPWDSPTVARASFAVGGQVRRLQGWVAINDIDYNPVPARFAVRGDGKLLWESGDVRKGDAAVEFSVDVSGIKVLTLETRSTGAHNGVHAVWFEPRLEK